MRKRYWFIILTVLALLAACGPATPSTPEDRQDSPQQEEDSGAGLETPLPVPDEPTKTPPPVNSYPAQPLPEPPSVIDEGYPQQPDVLPTPESYPGAYPAPEGFAWIIRPVGEQCAEPDANSYADLQEAVTALTAAGITVSQADMLNLMVCSACGCPTSAHFHVLIESDQLAAAESLGWLPE